jgi:hypothetical protein
LWNKKELPLTYNEKLEFTYDNICWPMKKVADLSYFNNSQFSNIVDKLSEVLYLWYWSWGVYGSWALKNIDSYLAQTWVLNQSPNIGIVANMHQYKYAVFTGSVCNYAWNYTLSNYPLYMSWYTNNESYLWSINFNYSDLWPLNSMQWNNIYFWPMYWADLYPYAYKWFTWVNAGMTIQYDYISGACGSNLWNTSLWSYPYWYLKIYSSKDKVFTQKSLEYWIRNDTFYNNALWKTWYEQNLTIDSYTFWKNLILCSD